MRTQSISVVWAVLLAATMSGTWSFAGGGGDHKYTTLTNAQVQEMLDKILLDIKENYYDPSFHGVDLDKQFAHDRELIAAAKSQDEALLYVAAAVESLNDSHTHFKPPVRPYGVDYGWTMQAIGDSPVYVTHVRPESDAAAKGLQAGDLVLSINGVPTTRQDITRLAFSYSVFPQSGFHLTVNSLDGKEKNLTVMAKVIQGQAMVTHSDAMTWMRVNGGKERRIGPNITSGESRYSSGSCQISSWTLMMSTES